jgi:hypothetical protein
MPIFLGQAGIPIIIGREEIPIIIGTTRRDVPYKFIYSCKLNI